MDLLIIKITHTRTNLETVELFLVPSNSSGIINLLDELLSKGYVQIFLEQGIEFKNNPYSMDILKTLGWKLADFNEKARVDLDWYRHPDNLIIIPGPNAQLIPLLNKQNIHVNRVYRLSYKI